MKVPANRKFSKNRKSAVMAIAATALLGWVLLAAGISHAQGEASIWGVITDSSGALIPAATVKVENVETGAVRDLVSDTEGRYDATLLAVGNYRVTVEKNGFQAETKTGITLVVGQRAQVDVALGLTQLQQSVTVTEHPDLIAVTNEDVSGLVGEQQVKDLPLNGRSYDQLLTLNPGVVNYTSQRAGGIGTSNSVVGNMFSASGRRPQENLYLLNGVEFTSASEINNTPGGASGQLLGVDAVREFSVVTRHLRRRVRQAPRRADQYRHRLRHQPVSRQRLRIPAQQRARRPKLLRRRDNPAISSATSSAARWADRSRRTRRSSSPTTKASARSSA